DRKQPILQLRSRHFDPFGQDKSALKLSCCNAAMKELFVGTLRLLAADNELATLDSDVQLLAREAGNGERDAQILVALLFDIVRRIAVCGAFRGAFEQSFQMLKTQQER